MLNFPPRASVTLGLTGNTKMSLLGCHDLTAILHILILIIMKMKFFLDRLKLNSDCRPLVIWKPWPSNGDKLFLLFIGHQYARFPTLSSVWSASLPEKNAGSFLEEQLVIEPLKWPATGQGFKINKWPATGQGFKINKWPAVQYFAQI